MKKDVPHRWMRDTWKGPGHLMIGHVYHQWLNETEQEVLAAGCAMLMDALFAEGVLLPAPRPEHPMLHPQKKRRMRRPPTALVTLPRRLALHLPLRYRAQYTPAFVRKFAICVVTVVWKLAQAEYHPLSSLGEELAAWAIVTEGRGVLDRLLHAGEKVPEAARHDVLTVFVNEYFEDLDFLLLFAASASECSDERVTALGCEDWFRPFSDFPSRTPHPFVWDTVQHDRARDREPDALERVCRGRGLDEEPAPDDDTRLPGGTAALSADDARGTWCAAPVSLLQDAASLPGAGHAGGRGPGTVVLAGWLRFSTHLSARCQQCDQAQARFVYEGYGYAEMLQEMEAELRHNGAAEDEQHMQAFLHHIALRTQSVQEQGEYRCVSTLFFCDGCAVPFVESFLGTLQSEHEVFAHMVEAAGQLSCLLTWLIERTAEVMVRTAQVSLTLAQTRKALLQEVRRHPSARD